MKVSQKRERGGKQECVLELSSKIKQYGAVLLLATRCQYWSTVMITWWRSHEASLCSPWCCEESGPLKTMRNEEF